jgi:hypothetical protein
MQFSVYLLGLFFYTEGGCNIFPRNVGRFLPYYMSYHVSVIRASWRRCEEVKLAITGPVCCRCNQGKVNFREKEKQVLDQILGPGRYDARIRPSGINGTGEGHPHTRCLLEQGLKPTAPPPLFEGRSQAKTQNFATLSLSSEISIYRCRKGPYA